MLNQINDIEDLPDEIEDDNNQDVFYNIDLLTEHMTKELNKNTMELRSLNNMPFHENYKESDQYDKLIKMKDINNKLIAKIEEYKSNNRDWEAKIENIQLLVQNLEDNNRMLKESNEKLKEENDYLIFKQRVSEEKEKIHEKNINSLKELHNEYDNQARNLEKEFITKEEKMKKKYELLETTLEEKYAERDNDQIERIENLCNDLNTLNRAFDDIEAERDELKETILSYDKILKEKEDEYDQIIISKDKRMRELELYIRSISDEANLQITKLSNNISEFDEEIKFYKKREIELNEEIERIKIKESAKIKEESLDYIKGMENRFSSENSELIKTIEILKSKVKNLENEINNANKTINLKNEENTQLSKELNKYYKLYSDHENQNNLILNQKDKELYQLNNKLNDYEVTIQKYMHNLTSIKNSYENISSEYKNNLLRKNEEIRFMKEKYDKTIKDLQRKLEEVIMKDDSFRSVTHKSIRIDSETPYKILEEDEMCKNISSQINYLKDKLDNYNI